MKGLSLVITTCTVLCMGSAAGAQTVILPPAATPRPDLAATIGWLSANKSELTDYNDWYNRSAQAALMFGWYWSPHLKTELEASVSGEAELHGAREEFINGVRFFTASEYAFSTRRLTLSGQYQFGENAWFHPHVATGIDINWEEVRRLDRDVYVYDPLTRLSRLAHRAVEHPPQTDTHVRPFLAAGFKGYFTQRGFVRSDLRVVFGRRVEEAILRFGFGFDF